MNGSRFLEEALPLVSTYFSGESVELSSVAVRVGAEEANEGELFVEHIKIRHAISCCLEISPIVQRIERAASSVSTTIRTQTDGVLRGRLDIPRYLSSRASSLSWPRTYPILITADSPSTPENALVVRILRLLLQRLFASAVPLNTAESVLVRKSKCWIQDRLRRPPWSRVVSNTSLRRLYSEASRRVERRQTGNEAAYLALLRFAKDWRLIEKEVGGSVSSKRLVASLLAFPADETFLDRVFEIWCIQSVANALVELGAELIAGPTSMSESSRKPIYIFEARALRVEVWFQKALPKEGAEWIYESTGSALRGLPDICIIANGSHRMLVDAKHKLVVGHTRSEETYKMLGYFENFRGILPPPTSAGVLVFMSHSGFRRRLMSADGRVLELLSAHPGDSLCCEFGKNLRGVLSDWLFRTIPSAGVTYES